MSQPPVLSVPTPAITSQPPRFTWRKVRRFLLRRLLITVVMLTLYVLSIGPMWWIWYSGMYLETESHYWAVAIYEPLRQACHIEWVNSIVASYIEWWNL